MQNFLRVRYGKRLPTDLVVKKIKELRNIQDLGYSLELLTIDITNETTVFIVHGFNSKSGCSIEYFDIEHALKLWNSILLYRLNIGEWYLDAKNNDDNVKGVSIYSQTRGPWFDYGEKINAFELALTVS